MLMLFHYLALGAGVSIVVLSIVSKNNNQYLSIALWTSLGLLIFARILEWRRKWKK